MFTLYRTRDPAQFRRPSTGLGWVVMAAAAPPRRPSDLAPRLPHDVDLVLALGLAKRPGDRFQSADELAGALADAVTGQLAPAIRDRGLALVRTGGWADPPAAAVRRRLASG